MHSGKFVLAQLLDWIQPQQFRRCVARYGGDYKVRRFSCWDQFLCLAFAQLTCRESLRDIEACLRSRRRQLYHLGLRGEISRTTLADANEARDWRIIEQSRAFFVIRAKERLNYCRLHSHPVVTTTGLRSDQTISLTGFYSRQSYPDKLRRVRFYDVEQERALVFLTNHFGLPALTVSRLYCLRWRVELFFKWIKQHLRIKAFYGTSPNAVRTQLWIAVSVYVLVAIIRKQLKIEASMFTILQILSISTLDKTPLPQLLAQAELQTLSADSHNQLLLFNQ